MFNLHCVQNGTLCECMVFLFVVLFCYRNQTQDLALIKCKCSVPPSYSIGLQSMFLSLTPLFISNDHIYSITDILIALHTQISLHSLFLPQMISKFQHAFILQSEGSFQNVTLTQLSINSKISTTPHSCTTNSHNLNCFQPHRNSCRMILNFFFSNGKF